MKRKEITDPKEMYGLLVLFYYLLLAFASDTTRIILGNTTLLAMILCTTLPILVALWLPLLDDRYRKLKKKEE